MESDLNQKIPQSDKRSAGSLSSPACQSSGGGGWAIDAHGVMGVRRGEGARRRMSSPEWERAG